MSVRTVVVAAVVGMAFVGGWWAHAQTGDGGMTLTATDHAEIRQIVLRLGEGADHNDSDLWVSQWTPDGSWTHPNGESYVGRERLTEYRRSTRLQGGGASGVRHWLNGVVLTPTADGATGRTYTMLLNIAVAPPTVVSAGRYDDVFVKTADGWRIKQRVVTSHTLPLRQRQGN